MAPKDPRNRVETPEPRSIIVVSDTHGGCRMGLCVAPARLDGGGIYRPSVLQKKVAAFWKEFRTDWVPLVTKGEPFILVVNGDALDGVHHRATTQISHNLSDQAEIAYEALKPLVDASDVYYHVRGTEAHVGPSGAEEERLAQRLGAKPDGLGNHARWELWLDLHGHLTHFTHHIGVTGSSAYEATAVGKELVEAYVEAGRWGRTPPQVMIRCLSDDTQLMTRSGWRGMGGVAVGDEVLTMHPLTSELQWQAVKEVVENDNEPEMIHFTGKGVDILVTPDHNMLVRSRQRHGLWREAPGGWMFLQASTVRESVANQSGVHLEIPVSGSYRGTPVPLTQAQLWLVGFFMADGSYVRKPDGRAYAMRVHQADERREEVERRLAEAGCTNVTRQVNSKQGTPSFDSRHGRFIYTRRDCSSWYINSKDSSVYMSHLNDDKTLRPWMLDLSKDQALSLVEGFAFGDGSTSCRRLFNSNERMLDQLQEILLKHGFKTNVRYQDYYTTKRGEKKRAGVLNYNPGVTAGIGQWKGRQMKIEPYGKASWCAVVPNGTLVTRRNGCVAIVGNSHRHRYSEFRVYGNKGLHIVSITPAWQLKTPYLFRLQGRLSEPQLGGIMVRAGEEELHTRALVKSMDRQPVEVFGGTRS